MFLPESISGSPDVFTWKDIRVKTAKYVFPVGTDAILLGTWVGKFDILPHHILDAGTGTGILALMLAQQFPSASIQAWDINPFAVELAAINFANSAWASRLQACLQDLLDDQPQVQQFDLIITNPPFHHQTLQSKEESLRVAKHLSVSEEKWIDRMVAHATEKSHMAMIVPGHRALIWIKAANTMGWYVHRRMDVYAHQYETEPVRTLLQFSTSLRKPVREQLYMLQSDGQRTHDFLTWLG